ncbi:MAG: hypothetical protein QOE70_4055 [Chthoniobacter sp.]|jgi:hypothetical protein|nr:hypothetical protein [Chthoniobacter sp.]
MSAKEADINTIIGKVITRSHAIEKLLRTHYNVTGRGLHKAIDDLSDTLPAVLARTIRVVAIARNAAAHPDGFKIDTVAPDFDRLCNEIELLIPYFASQQHTKAAQPPKEPKSATPKPEHNNVTATNRPANQSKPWTPAEERQLTDGFEAQATIPELARALNRGIGGVQRRLIKLGKLAADQYKPYPLESE